MEKILKAKLKNGKFQNVSPVRSKIMSCIPGRRNRSTEVAFRLALVRAGISGWKMHMGIQGCPDFFFPKNAIGCLRRWLFLARMSPLRTYSEDAFKFLADQNSP
jgi:hypothetical protein